MRIDGTTGRLRGAYRGVRRVLIALAVALALTLGQPVAAAPARADRGLEVSSESRYTFDPTAEVVRATMQITLRNTSANQPISGGGYRYFYFNTYGVPLPAAAADVRAHSNGAALRVSREAIDGEPGYRMVTVGFPDLRFEELRTIELSFTLEGQPPRSEDPTRIGPSHATFPVFGAGDPGRSTVEVSLPAELTVESSTDSFVASDGPDRTQVLTTSEDNLSPGFSAIMSIRSREIGAGREITAGGVPLTLVHFPDDTEWADFVETWADRSIPVLEELAGLAWPGEIDRIREDSSPDVRGFSGWYSRAHREIVLGEALEHRVLFHELAHAWSGPIEQRWISEGFAEVLAERTAARVDAPFEPQPEVSHSDSLAVPLDEWPDTASRRSTATDRWAYPASHQVMTALLDGLDDEQLSMLLHDAHTATSAWSCRIAAMSPGRPSAHGTSSTCSTPTPPPRRSTAPASICIGPGSSTRRTSPSSTSVARQPTRTGHMSASRPGAHP